MNSKSRSRKLDKEEMTYSSEVKGSLGLRALRVMALVVGLVAALSADFFRLLVGLEGSEEEADAPPLFFDATGTGSPVARGGSS